MPVPRAVIRFCFEIFITLLIGMSGAIFTADASSIATMQAEQALKVRHYSVAVNFASEAIRQNANDGEAYECRFLALSYLERFEAAIKDFEQVKRLIPDADYAVFYQGATCYVALNRYDKALAALNDSLKSKPTSRSYRMKGQILWKLGRKKEAFENFSRAIRLTPSEYWIYEDRANCYIQENRLQDAIKDLNKLIELRPDDSRAYEARSKVYEKLGDKKSAARDRKRGAELVKTTWD